MKDNILLKSIGGFYYVKTDKSVIECKAKGKFRNLSLSPLAGDKVDVEYDGSTYIISKIYPRKNQFLRPPFANLDTLLMVVSTIEPSPNFLVIDKLCAIAHHKDVEVVIIITKADLQSCKDVKDIYEKSGYKVFVTDKSTDLESIKKLLSGKVCAFAGNSGVGKSSLLNRLFPNLSLETNEISQKLGRGKHTTRHVEIYDLDGCMVADTPGFSSIELDGDNFISKDDLQFAFPEIGKHHGECKFSDCSHTTEKGCKILQQVAAGEISESRYQSYVSLYNRQKNIKQWELK